jgi:hypothetical protein
LNNAVGQLVDTLYGIGEIEARVILQLRVCFSGRLGGHAVEALKCDTERVGGFVAVFQRGVNDLYIGVLNIICRAGQFSAAHIFGEGDLGNLNKKALEFRE